MIKIKNISETAKTFCGQTIEPGNVYFIQDNEIINFANDEDFIAAINSEDILVYNADDESLAQETGVQVLTNHFHSSTAIDKNGIDQEITGTDWTEITGERILWDLNGDYDVETNNFIVPFDGIYFSDLQIRVTDIVNVTDIELALFKRDTPVDDYWFILDKKEIYLETECQLSGSTSFDFYEGEEYVLKIKLSGTNASCTLSGSDDYTAMGYSFTRSLY
jgi:hypothetical protein